MTLPFSVVIRPGEPLHDQVVFAVTKAVVTGQMRPGDPFPSVRALSQELQVNPNTVQRIVSTLVERGLLETRPGIGSVVASARRVPAHLQRAALAAQVERLVIEAKQLGLKLSDVLQTIRRTWK